MCEPRVRITFDTSQRLKDKYERILYGARKEVMNYLLELIVDFLDEGDDFWEQYAALASKKIHLAKNK